MTEYILVILWLVILEGLLSVDNALVLATMVSVLPKDRQKKALKYGIWGAFIFRIIAVLLAVWLIKLWWFKILGGAYLLYIAFKGLRKPHYSGEAARAAPNFWLVVAQVEMMDMAFSLDSILAAVALSDNTIVIIIGGILGIIAMRFAAGVFISLLERYPIFKKTAYVLLVVIGAKLIVSVWWHPPHWLFFGMLFAILGFSFLLQKDKPRQ